ncbi:hypothetical protein BH10ACT7_BH10ACT7_10130 [soil metagenome]
MSASELFDTHCHLFERGYHGRFGFLVSARGDELASYERFRAEFGITRSLVVGYEEADQYQGNNAYIESLAAERDWIVPLRFVARSAAAAFGEQISLYAMDPTAAQAAAELLARTEGGPPRIVSLNAVPEALAVLAPVIRRLESTWVLISHLGLPGPVDSLSKARDRLAPLLSLADCPQVSVKLSGQYAASAGGYPHEDAQVIVDVLAETFGVGPLVWGSDFSPCLEFVSFDEAIHCLLPTGVTAQERARILAGNASRMFDHYGAAA